MTNLGRARVNQRGFTLAELLVAMAIVALIMAGLMTLLKKGNESYLAGANQVEAQAALRAALERMTQEIREAGYNPRGLPPCTAGLVPPNCLDPIILQFPTSFTIQNDWDGNGTINNAISVCMTYSWAACPNAGGPNNRGELITYSVAGGNLTRLETPQGGGQQVLVQNVVQANLGGVQPFFQYLDANGNVAATQDAIRTVVVNFQVGVQGQTPGSWQTGAVQVAMSDRIRLRNR